jgi:hypothetical protein
MPLYLFFLISYGHYDNLGLTNEKGKEGEGKQETRGKHVLSGYPVGSHSFVCVCLTQQIYLLTVLEIEIQGQSAARIGFFLAGRCPFLVCSHGFSVDDVLAVSSSS